MVAKKRVSCGITLVIVSSIVSLISISLLDLSTLSLTINQVGKAISAVHTVQTPVCRDGYVFMRNRILPEDVTNIETRKIPKLIHFIVQSKCIPNALAESINSTWYSLEDHSIYFHDPEDIRKFTSRGKEGMFPSIDDAFNCAKFSRAKFEIARFAILWELGGIAIDINQIPDPAILENNVLVKDDEECVFENKDKDKANPRFLSCAPQHSALYVAITLYMNQFNIVNECFDKEFCSMDKLQNEMYLGFMFRIKSMMKRGESVDKSVRRNFFINQPFFFNMNITQIYPTDGHQLFTPIEIQNGDIDLKVLSQDKYESQCKAFMVYDNNSYDVNMESLLEVLVGKDQVTTFQEEKSQSGTCPSDLKFVPSFLDANTTTSNSKIPKIIHMTSKSHCFTEAFLNNIKRWFVDGYSFFLHDDDAVDRLIFGREWPQFPLLKESLTCIPSGAGKADIWRYLMLWEYGGIYTDIDNAPGSQLFFDNHTSAITDDMDAFFEQERGGFPSQYFFASK